MGLAAIRDQGFTHELTLFHSRGANEMAPVTPVLTLGINVVARQPFIVKFSRSVRLTATRKRHSNYIGRLQPTGVTDPERRFASRTRMTGHWFFDSGHHRSAVKEGRRGWQRSWASGNRAFRKRCCGWLAVNR